MTRINILAAAVVPFLALLDSALAVCNADNCYRALFPCQSAAALATASAYCATITAGGSTAINYPARATSACGTAPDRYVSACACGPTCTTSTLVTLTSSSTSTLSTASPCPSSGGLVPNGGFECGLSPWTVQVIDPAVTAGLTSPGNDSTTAFEVDLPIASVTVEDGVSARITSGTVRGAANVPGLVKFSTFFVNPDAGFVGVKINGNAVFTVDARDHQPLGVWHSNQFDYTPQGTDNFVITFEFLFGAYPSVMKIDSVEYNWLH